MKFPAYPNYKSTGVEWLSEIPVHWELIRLRFLLLDGAEGIKIGPFGSQLTSDMLVEIGYKVYGQENVIAGDFDKGQRYITDKKFSEMSVYEISPNDLLVTMMGTAGRCKVVPEAISAGVMDSHLLRMRFGRKADPKFVELLIDKSIYVSHQVRLNGKGSIMHGLNSSIIKELLVALPSADEQASILSFLDHETARIDALIEEQQRLIELLKEKRQAVISHAVTKGLDPTVPMKDSGVEWLGEVPAHWALVPFGLAFEYQEGPGIMAVDFRDEGVPLVRISGVQGRWVTLEGCNYLEPSKVKEKWAHFRLDKGDLIISGSASMGLVSEVGEDAAGAVAYTGLIRLKPRANISIRDFIRSVVGSYQFHAQIDLLKAGSTIQHFGPTHLSQMKVVLPPVNEQAQIAAYVDTISVQFDELLGEAENTNALLQERRSALISAAVTGKIDVRGWQPPASAQAPESAVIEAV